MGRLKKREQGRGDFTKRTLEGVQNRARLQKGEETGTKEEREQKS